jgi:predicted DCC family thiol-disulfide oxidoreductase YuxK
MNPVILFDGICNLCNASVNFIIDHDPEARFRFVALQSEAGQTLLQQHQLRQTDYESVVLIEAGKVYRQSGAALRIARHLKGWSWLYGLRIVPAFIRDSVYRLIARNRYRLFGKRESCRMPTPELKNRFLV